MDDTIEMDESWNAEKGRLKKRFAILTDDDLLLEESKNEEMLLKLQVKLGKTKEELHKLLTELLFTSYDQKKIFYSTGDLDSPAEEFKSPTE